MKKIIMLLAAITLFACSEKSNNPYVTLEGNINNADIDSILILGKDFKKSIKVNEDGSFKDTLKVVDGFHGITDGKQQGFLYLKNGYDMEIEMDMENFPESVTYQGEGSITNKVAPTSIPTFTTTSKRFATIRTCRPTAGQGSIWLTRFPHLTTTEVTCSCAIFMNMPC